MHEKKHLDAVIKKIHTDKAIFGGFTDEMDRFQRTMMNIITRKKTKSKEYEIKKILNDTISKLNRI
jgi:hypothetical protein